MAAHLAAACIPQVDTIAQSNGKDIMRRPINKVQVEVILQRGRIQHLERRELQINSVKSLNFGTTLLKIRLFMQLRNIGTR
jgi:hypothetical protein